MDRKTADVSKADQALHDFAEKLTREPSAMAEDDLDTLSHCGFTDEQLSDAVQVISYFNYINRIADGFGVDLKGFMPPSEERRMTNKERQVKDDA